MFLAALLGDDTTMATTSPRISLIERITKETKVQVALSLDGGPLDYLPLSFDPPSHYPSQETAHHASQSSDTQQIWVYTGIGFLDHMLHALSKHAGWSLRVMTVGDLASTYSLILRYFHIYPNNRISR